MQMHFECCGLIDQGHPCNLLWNSHSSEVREDLVSKEFSFINYYLLAVAAVGWQDLKRLHNLQISW